MIDIDNLQCELECWGVLKNIVESVVVCFEGDLFEVLIVLGDQEENEFNCIFFIQFMCVCFCKDVGLMFDWIDVVIVFIKEG